MVLEKYINFSKIYESIANDDELNNLFMKRNKDYIHQVDSGILEIRNKSFYTSYFSMLEDASKVNYVKTSEQFKDNRFESNFITYSSTKQNYHICYINISEEDDDKTFEIFGLIDDDTQDYIFVGLDENHPFLCTKHFEYFQSDGSTVFDTACFNNNKYKISTIFTLMMKYFMFYTYQYGDN